LIRKDYILRYFDELAKVLAVVLQLKNDLKPLEAESQVNDFASSHLGIDLDEITKTESSLLIDYLIQKKSFTLDHFKLLEDLLYHKYLLNTSNIELKKCTLVIFNYLTEIDTDFSFNRMNRINELT
jgi:hypothetical protein